MATIAQIIDYMNYSRITWHPKLLVDVIQVDAKTPGYEAHGHGMIAGNEDLIFVRMDCQKFIGHYYIWNGEGNTSGIMLIPTNNSKYIKAEIQTQW